mmetsp:Transcript_22455/g.34446  ORF Transcript_22455/g.34446 Transcript_22455/m.34446 type:complete len:135 (+) Transcript_22455:101-505(+)
MRIEDLNMCFLPQITHLQVLHENYPNATFVLNILDNPDQWFDHYENTTASTIFEDLKRCLKDMTDIQSLFGKSNSEERAKLLYTYHIDSIRASVRDNPSHELVEVRVDGNDVKNELQRSFWLDDESIKNDKCLT